MDTTTISWSELRKPAGYLLMIGLAEDGSDMEDSSEAGGNVLGS